MPGFFKRFFLSDFGPAPAADITVQPSFSGERIVEVIYSNSKRQRVFITSDEAWHYRIYSQWWDTSNWEAGYGARWSPAQKADSHTDSIDRARDAAVEVLKCRRGANQTDAQNPAMMLQFLMGIVTVWSVLLAPCLFASFVARRTGASIRKRWPTSVAAAVLAEISRGLLLGLALLPYILSVLAVRWAIHCFSAHGG